MRQSCRQSRGSHEAVMRQSRDSHDANIRQSSSSHEAVDLKSSGTRRAVVRQSLFKLKTHHQSKYRFLFLHHFLLQARQFRHFPQFFDYFFRPCLEFRFQFLQRLFFTQYDGPDLNNSQKSRPKTPTISKVIP